MDNLHRAMSSPTTLHKEATRESRQRIHAVRSRRIPATLVHATKASRSASLVEPRRPTARSLCGNVQAGPEFHTCQMLAKAIDALKQRESEATLHSERLHCTRSNTSTRTSKTASSDLRMPARAILAAQQNRVGCIVRASSFYEARR